ncbi:YcnI family protein [Paenibacillus sp. N1-5-1-14]|uniref:YcnI family copper-binding membrane protein n=1 Tax=Paenibacillus radicibacter TaxID=2972488 RepID=UPI0021598CDA|nr:YcnI family protein [Paenibacillus radicibacter]MCR8644941.1 YcnI family protein [Paenibacillus radicibacter]
MRKMTLSLFTMMLCMLLFAGIASAHVTVMPSTSTQGAYEKFTVRVPVEKEIPTTKVEVKFALDSVSVSRVEPKADWKYEVAKDASGKITGITWTTTGEGLKNGEFAEFNMQGKVSDTATAITWKAYQTYKDGSVVEWTGAEGSDKPASITKVNPKAANASKDSHGNVTADAKTPAKAETTEQETSQLPLYLSIAALALGALALILTLVRKKA